jgi:enoyl-CoA hydratase/carnithine racemase
MPYLQRDGDVFVLYLGNEGDADNENVFSVEWMAALHAALDEAEASEGPAALVLTATGKFFSTGLDVAYAFSNFDALPAYLDQVHGVYSRILAFPMITVAAIQGHAFGAGAMLATAADFRVMRVDRGFYCLPEVDRGMPFPLGMSALLNARLPKQTAVEAMLTARRYGGNDAVAAGIVEAAVGEDELLPAAIAQAAAHAGKRGPNLAGIKRRVHGELIADLDTKTADTDFGFAS